MMTLTSACLTQFPENPSLREIAVYVENLRERHLPGADLNTAPTELVIRAALGESELIREVLPRDIVVAQLVIVNAVTNDHRLIGGQREAFVAEILDALD
jgi:hypothetical protein